MNLSPFRSLGYLIHSVSSPGDPAPPRALPSLLRSSAHPPYPSLRTSERFSPF